MRECGKLGVVHVSLLDRNELIGWFKGSVDHIDQLALTGEERPTKRARIDGPEALPQPENKDETATRAVEQPDDVPHKAADLQAKEPQSISNFALESGLSVDRIAQLKEKVKLKKKTSDHAMERHELQEGDEISHSTGSHSVFDTKITRDIMSKEKLLKTQEGVLQVPNKKFDRIANSWKVLVAKDKKQPQKSVAQATRRNKPLPPVKTHDRYKPINQDEFWSETHSGCLLFPLWHVDCV
eukprot:TRINITY_DN5847_c0_g2_i3.p1 TRINITY_DN5847_c0_g2~~TRINITY_DN5847_c0_g2_i3.p1  ORF type:complete len:240 (+),score=46.93 TRINITY_DN5847_c0_g2_i3:317-1036(+)